MKKDSIHLNESEIIRSVLDQNDLPDEVKHHISVCPVCGKKKEEFEYELNNLTHMTEKFTPLPQKRILLPLPSSAGICKPVNPLCNRRSAFITGMAAAMFLIVTGWIILNNEYSTAMIIREMEEDQRLITEIQYIEENILPDVYTDISGESYGYFDEEFLDFVVPAEENRNSV